MMKVLTIAVLVTYVAESSSLWALTASPSLRLVWALAGPAGPVTTRPPITATGAGASFFMGSLLH
jgi:hypothetical protein